MITLAKKDLSKNRVFFFFTSFMYRTESLYVTSALKGGGGRGRRGNVFFEGKSLK